MHQIQIPTKSNIGCTIRNFNCKKNKTIKLIQVISLYILFLMWRKYTFWILKFLFYFCCFFSSLNSISSLGRNIILTTVPAGTKLIAGNKPVSFVTAQQFQQLQQQGQATQVSMGHVAQGSFSSISLIVD